MKKLLILFFFVPHLLFAQEGITDKNYKIYSTKLGKEVDLKHIVDEMNHHDVLIFGEEHNDSVGHFLEQALWTGLYAQFGSNTSLSLEMFDRDVQLVMEEYLKGYIREKNFKKDARVWSNYRDYRPLIEHAKDKHLEVVCANSPSRYTNLAGRKGQKALMELPKEAKKYFAPLPYDTASGAYYDKLMALTGHAPSGKDTGKKALPAMSMGNFNLIVAQSLWDATMAYSIAEYYKKNRDKKIMQINGRFHSDEKFAIVTQLKKYGPKIKVLTISCTNDENFPNIDWTTYSKNGDYLLITDPKVPKTYKD